MQDSSGERLSGSPIKPQFEKSHLPNQELKKQADISTSGPDRGRSWVSEGTFKGGVSAVYKLAFAWFTRLLFLKQI